ncbi:aconitase X [Fodinicurvata halophila]|uniref:Aconitase X n=1 Tax=Fodinicurvata halophila TaxID=1419723 RepID=A0ABV8UPJ4_9PROT
MALALSAEEQAVADGRDGPGAAMALRILAESARLLGAERLIPIASSHIDGCLYHGDSGVAFAERLVEGGARVAVPTTLNVGALDLMRPEQIRLDAHERDMALRLMRAHEALGCRPTWTCAPYQAGHRPAPGIDVAWGESNAVAFVNSVLGARSNRYGDFLDLCCAITGRAPATGLHLAENRKATLLVDTSAIPDPLKALDVFYPVLGAWYGRAVGEAIGVIDGLPPDLSEDSLKAFAAAAASSGSVALFHAAGLTPEAPDAEMALGGAPPQAILRPTPEDLLAARDSLSTVDSQQLDAIAVGSPHFSNSEFKQLLHLLDGRESRVPFYACTGRHVIEQLQAEGLLQSLETAGIRIVADTCVVVTPILEGFDGVLMTNSGKFAHYAPGNTGYGVIYGSLSDCVESAVSGRVRRDESLWSA